MAVMMTVPDQATGGGLSTQLGEAVIENLQIGQSYNLKQLANLSLVVTNTSDFPVDLLMEPLLPAESELKMEASDIPDKSWISFSEDQFKLGPGEKASSDIIITIPRDESHLGKKYQVMIWSHTLGTGGGGMNLAYGLKSRIIFTIDTTMAGEDYKPPVSNASAGFTVSPKEIFLQGVETGKIYDVAEYTGQILEITNPGDCDRTFILESRTVENSLAMITEGFEDAPNASYLKFSENEFTIPSGEKKSVSVYLDFPSEEKFSGRNYVFVIYAHTADEGVTGGVYSRLYASIK